MSRRACACPGVSDCSTDQRHGRDGGVAVEARAVPLGGDALPDGLGGVGDRVEPDAAGGRVEPEPPQRVGVDFPAVEPVHRAQLAGIVRLGGHRDPAAAERLDLRRAHGRAGPVGDQSPRGRRGERGEQHGPRPLAEVHPRGRPEQDLRLVDRLPGAVPEQVDRQRGHGVAQQPAARPHRAETERGLGVDGDPGRGVRVVLAENLLQGQLAGALVLGAVPERAPEPHRLSPALRCRRRTRSAARAARRRAGRPGRRTGGCRRCTARAAAAA